MAADGVSGDVLLDLLEDDLVVGLVDLDDLLDPPVDVAAEEGLDGGGVRAQKIFGR